MASSPITSWQIDGETVETETDFICLGSKITADGDYSHEIKRWLLLGKVMTNLDSILKRRDITLPKKVHLVKAMVFPVVMYGCERWTVKKAECWRIDAFELWCWRRLLRVPWTARRSSHLRGWISNWLKEGPPEGVILPDSCRSGYWSLLLCSTLCPRQSEPHWFQGSDTPPLGRDTHCVSSAEPDGSMKGLGDSGW